MKTSRNFDRSMQRAEKKYVNCGLNWEGLSQIARECWSDNFDREILLDAAARARTLERVDWLEAIARRADLADVVFKCQLDVWRDSILENWEDERETEKRMRNHLKNLFFWRRENAKKRAASSLEADTYGT